MKRLICRLRRHPIRATPGPINMCACRSLTIVTATGTPEDMLHAADCMRGLAGTMSPEAAAALIATAAQIETWAEDEALDG